MAWGSHEMRKISKGFAMFEVVIGIALAVIALAVFLSMQSGTDVQSSNVKEGSDVGLLINKALTSPDNNFNAKTNDPEDDIYAYDEESGQVSDLQTYLGASDNFMSELSKQGIKKASVEVIVTRDPDEQLP